MSHYYYIFLQCDTMHFQYDSPLTLKPWLLYIATYRVQYAKISNNLANLIRCIGLFQL
jgi:hypothetical protein